MSAAPLVQLLERLNARGFAARRSGRGWSAQCPAHADHNPSLSITEGHEGRVLLHCFAGCELSEILTGLGLSVADLFAQNHDNAARTPRLAPIPAVPPKRPPRDEVRWMWDRCTPVDQDEGVSRWLKYRGLDAHRIADLDLARALPYTLEVPGWARVGGRDWTAGYRLVMGMFDHSGTLASLHARAVHPVLEPKGSFPAGFSVRGLVLADQLGQRMLQGARPASVVVLEGVPDLLAAASSVGEACEDAAAMVGIVAGSWTCELASRVPDGARVIVAVHDDEAGQRYAAGIAQTFAGRSVRLLRWRAREVTT